MEDKETGNTSTDDEEVDVTSSKFNPLKALYSKKFKPPVENVKVLDNVSAFFARIKRAGNVYDKDLEAFSKPINQQKKGQPVIEVDKEKYHVTQAGRTFLKEQAPVQGGQKAKFKKDIFVKMDSAKGPIALLKKFRTDRTRVKIYIRKEHGIKGFITGFIEFFDKHLNIVLVDCIEVFKRRKFKFSENNVPLLGEPEDCSKLLQSMGIKVPEISTKSINRKNVECTRKIPQLMIRGEDIVLIGEDKSEGDAGS